MPTTVERRTGLRNPWLLPVILGLIVAAIILAVVVGPKLRSAANATATVTATPQVVTATPGQATATAAGPTSTPGGATATPGGSGAVPPSATPAGNQGASTPLPNTTPLPTVAGLTLGMITRPQHRVDEIQKGADTKDQAYLYYLDPRQVVLNDLPHEGFTQGFQIVQPASASPTATPHTGADGRPIVTFYVTYQGKTYTVQVGQPGKRGALGIWVILTVFPGKQS